MATSSTCLSISSFGFRYVLHVRLLLYPAFYSCKVKIISQIFAIDMQRQWLPLTTFLAAANWGRSELNIKHIC